MISAMVWRIQQETSTYRGMQEREKGESFPLLWLPSCEALVSVPKFQPEENMYTTCGMCPVILGIGIRDDVFHLSGS